MTGLGRVVALGGGHGLSVSLRALRQLGKEPIAIAGTGDDGGSSGRLRAHLGVPPPGDLRMALAALADEGLADEGLWLRVLQHRFRGTGDIEGHALGNLLLVALWEETGDVVAGLDLLGTVLGARGRVLPNSLEPVEVVADVVGRDGTAREVHGQARLTAAGTRIIGLRLIPADPPACPQAVTAIADASHVVIGPGSWFTSILTHTRVPGIEAALRATAARRILIVNAGPQESETPGYSASAYLRSWIDQAPGIALDDVIVASGPHGEGRRDAEALATQAARLGVRVHAAEVLAGPGQHDPALLARALGPLLD